MGYQGLVPSPSKPLGYADIGGLKFKGVPLNVLVLASHNLLDVTSGLICRTEFVDLLRHRLDVGTRSKEHERLLAQVVKIEVESLFAQLISNRTKHSGFASSIASAEDSARCREIDR